jgi:colanic acid biosynthesis protein WcaH
MKHSRFLTHEEFSFVAERSPLISIDAVITDHTNNVLMGLRANQPARGYYFVPGGIILKHETIKLAFERIVRAEIGQLV